MAPLALVALCGWWTIVTTALTHSIALALAVADPAAASKPVLRTGTPAQPSARDHERAQEFVTWIQTFTRWPRNAAQ
jgi:hypothetical protein